jgi:hypothetical protein
MITDDNPHSVCTEYSQECYWRDNRAVGVYDAADRVELGPLGRPYLTLAFKLPDQRYEFDKVKNYMKMAYERGASDQKAKIGKLMRELIAFN